MPGRSNSPLPFLATPRGTPLTLRAPDQAVAWSRRSDNPVTKVTSSDVVFVGHGRQCAIDSMKRN